MWLTAPPGRLSPWEQARALGLRSASKVIFDGEVRQTWIAGQLVKTDGSAPSQPALSQFFAKVDADPQWFPGKHSGARRGPPPQLTPAKRRCIATSAMSQKSKGDEPSVAETIARCPAATLNPETGEPFCDKTIRKVFLEDGAQHSVVVKLINIVVFHPSVFVLACLRGCMHMSVSTPMVCYCAGLPDACLKNNLKRKTGWTWMYVCFVISFQLVPKFNANVSS